jgi:cell division protein FtsB
MLFIFAPMEKKNKIFFKKIISLIFNKYFITLVAIIIWVTFFDQDDLISQYKLTQKLHQLKTEQKYYEEEIEKCKTEMNELRTNPTYLEKFAREKYLFKKDNEEIFVIVKDTVPKMKGRQGEMEHPFAKGRSPKDKSVLWLKSAYGMTSGGMKQKSSR